MFTARSFKTSWFDALLWYCGQVRLGHNSRQHGTGANKKPSEIHGCPLIALDQSCFQRSGDARLRARSHPAPVFQVSVTFLESPFDGHIARRTFSISKRHDKRIRPQLLCHQLKFHIHLAGQQKQLGCSEINDRNVDWAASLSAPSPAQAQCRQALAKRLWIRFQPFLQILPGEARIAARFQL